MRTRAADSYVIWNRLVETGSNLAMIVNDPDRFPSPETEK